MNTQVKKIKVVPIVISLMIVSGMFFARAGQEIHGNSLPIKVDLSDMKFGDVYPGQEASKNFVVEYDGNSGSGEYSITKIHKAKHNVTVPDGYKGTVSSYCQTTAGIADETRCYRYLCPFLTVTSAENEGDTADKASVTKTDASDTWTVHLKTPALYGKVVQGYDGDLVSESGEYGCDLSFDVGLPPAPVCGNSLVQDGEECDDGNILNGDGCSSSCKIEYGTISGYKYNDKNNNGKKDCGENGLSGVEIQLVTCPYAPLAAGASAFTAKYAVTSEPVVSPVAGTCTIKATTTTDAKGRYEFVHLRAGDYGVREIAPAGWVQTLPAGGESYYFKLSSNADKTEVNFLNHHTEIIVEPVCGDGKKDKGEECDDGNKTSGDGCSKICTNELGSISGCKYNDKDADGVIDDGEGKINGFKIWMLKCAGSDDSVCTKAAPQKTIDLDSEGCYSFTGLTKGNYVIGELGVTDWRQTYPASKSVHVIYLEGGEEKTKVDFLNTKIVPAGPVCGNGKVETNESCDDGNILSGDGCSSTCSTESHGCSGSCGVVIPPKISNEKVVEIGCNNAKITWTTNKKTDSRVVCSESPIANANLGSKPDYGYAFSTSTYDTDPKVTGHGITLFDLKENTNYFCRAISTSSSRYAHSTEVAFRTGICKIIEPPVVVDKLYIYNLRLKSISKTCATLTWDTNRNGTTCTVYAGSSKVLSIKPTYGYDFMTSQCSNLGRQAKTHTETICGLNPCTNYNFRLSSTNGTQDAVTDEQQMKTLCQEPSTYYPRTYVPSVAATEPVKDEGKVEAAATQACPECEVNKVCQDTVKTVVEKKRYMSCEDWFILLLILITLILLINALRNRGRGRYEEEIGSDGILLGGSAMNADRATEEQKPNPIGEEKEDKIELD